jgi:hypothetical protein
MSWVSEKDTLFIDLIYVVASQSVYASRNELRDTLRDEELLYEPRDCDNQTPY